MRILRSAFMVEIAGRAICSLPGRKGWPMSAVACHGHSSISAVRECGEPPRQCALPCIAAINIANTFVARLFLLVPRAGHTTERRRCGITLSLAHKVSANRFVACLFLRASQVFVRAGWAVP
jgi:hypothetical protein